VAPLLSYNPSAVEIIDNICLDMARTQKVYADLFPKEVGAILLIEFDNDNIELINKSISSIKETFIGNGKLATGIQVYDDTEVMSSVWKMRTLIAGYINRFPEKFQPA